MFEYCQQFLFYLSNKTSLFHLFYAIYNVTYSIAEFKPHKPMNKNKLSGI